MGEAYRQFDLDERNEILPLHLEGKSYRRGRSNDGASSRTNREESSGE